MKIIIVFDDDEVKITGEDFEIKGTNIIVYAVAKFLDNNSIQGSKKGFTDDLARVITFEIEDKNLLLLNIEKVMTLAISKVNKKEINYV